MKSVHDIDHSQAPSSPAHAHPRRSRHCSYHAARDGVHRDERPVGDFRAKFRSQNWDRGWAVLATEITERRDTERMHHNMQVVCLPSTRHPDIGQTSCKKCQTWRYTDIWVTVPLKTCWADRLRCHEMDHVPRSKIEHDPNHEHQPHVTEIEHSNKVPNWDGRGFRWL